jgi:hypothetical protein
MIGLQSNKCESTRIHLNAGFFLSSSTPARAGGRFTDSLFERLIGSEVVRFTGSLPFHRGGCEIVRFTDSQFGSEIGSEIVK